MASLDKDMGVIENNIHQTNNQSVQDAINYGIRLNNRLAFLMADQQRGDFPPTDQALEVREQISVAVDKELDDLEKVWVEELGKLNDMIKALGISPIKAPARKERKP